MHRRNSHQQNNVDTHYRMQEYPATELAEALGMPAADRVAYDYTRTMALKERLVEVCTRCAIRFGLPDQARKHLGDAIGLPDEPVLRYPHREIQIDARWEALANALRFPSHGDFPLVQLQVVTAHELNTIKEALPSLVEDLDLQRRPRHETPHRPLFRPIAAHVGDQLVNKLEKVKAYGDGDTSSDGLNRTIARNIHRQMRIYMAIGPAWTLVNSLESLALTSQTLPSPSSKASSRKPLAPTPRWNLTGEKPQEPPPTLPGLTWMWVQHEGKRLPAAWGGPQNEAWGRWEPQFPNTARPHTSLFGQSSRYLELHLGNSGFRGSTTRELLDRLRTARLEFEETRTIARREGYFSESFEATIRSRLIKDQDEVLHRFIDEIFSGRGTQECP